MNVIKKASIALSLTYGTVEYKASSVKSGLTPSEGNDSAALQDTPGSALKIDGIMSVCKNIHLLEHSFHLLYYKFGCVPDVI